MIFSVSGNIYITGHILSDDWQGSDGAYQTDAASGYDAFIALLNPDLTTIEQMTYLGSSFTDYCHNIALHPISGEVYVAGSTYGDDFPGTTGGSRAVRPGGTGCGDSFVLAPSESCTIAVSFNPATTGIRAANITISFDDPDEVSLDIPHIGTGIDGSGTGDGDDGTDKRSGEDDDTSICFIDALAF